MHIYHMINSFGNSQKGTLDASLFHRTDHAFLTVDDRETHIAKQLFDQFGGNLFLLDDTQPIFFTGMDTLFICYYSVDVILGLETGQAPPIDELKNLYCKKTEIKSYDKPQGHEFSEVNSLN